MPKVTRTPEEVRHIAAAIREQFGGAFLLTQTQVRQVIGYESKEATREWLSTLVPKRRNGRNVWLVLDVAQKIMEGDAS